MLGIGARLDRSNFYQCFGSAFSFADPDPSKFSCESGFGGYPGVKGKKDFLEFFHVSFEQISKNSRLQITWNGRLTQKTYVAFFPWCKNDSSIFFFSFQGFSERISCDPNPDSWSLNRRKEIFCMTRLRIQTGQNIRIRAYPDPKPCPTVYTNIKLTSVVLIFKINSIICNLQINALLLKTIKMLFFVYKKK